MNKLNTFSSVIDLRIALSFEFVSVDAQPKKKKDLQKLKRNLRVTIATEGLSESKKKVSIALSLADSLLLSSELT